MPIKIEIPDGQVGLFREIYNTRYQELNEAVKAANKEIEDMRPILLQLGIISAPKVENEVRQQNTSLFTDEYNPKWGWLDRCMFVIRKHGASTPQQIIDILHRDYARDLTKETLAGSVPSTLSVEARKPEGSKVIRYKKEGEREYVYDVK